MDAPPPTRPRERLLPWLWTLALFCALGGAPAEALAQEPNPLRPVADLVLGSWEAEDSRNVLEWGLGERFIRSRSYFPAGGDWTLVSEGMWWWDAEAGAIKGIAFAVSMPVERFEYTSRVEGTTIIHDLQAFGAMGGGMREIWEVGPDAYEWQLVQPGPDGDTPLMGGRYQRVR